MAKKAGFTDSVTEAKGVFGDYDAGDILRANVPDPTPSNRPNKGHADYTTLMDL